MDIILIVTGLILLIMGLFAILYPKQRYLNKNNDLHNIVLFGTKKDIHYGKAAIINTLSYEYFPVLIYMGVFCFVFGMLSYLNQFQDNYSVNTIIVFYFIGYTYLFIISLPFRIYKKHQENLTDFFDLESYINYYKHDNIQNPTISIKQEWSINKWILIVFLVSTLIIIAFNKPHMSYKTLFSIILVFFALINIKLLETQTYQYKFVKKTEEWATHVKQLRLSSAVFITLTTYTALFIVLLQN